jgi:hypothetical protein
MLGIVTDPPLPYGPSSSYVRNNPGIFPIEIIQTNAETNSIEGSKRLHKRIIFKISPKPL